MLVNSDIISSNTDSVHLLFLFSFWSDCMCVKSSQCVLCISNTVYFYIFGALFLILIFFLNVFNFTDYDFTSV